MGAATLTALTVAQKASIDTDDKAEFVITGYPTNVSYGWKVMRQPILLRLLA